MTVNATSVLVVEDEKPLAHALELKLGHEGMKVKVVHDGQSCLDELQSGDYAVVLLDLMMPVMDGFQVLGELQKRGNMPHVIVLSNLSQKEDEERVLSLGAKKFMVKSNTPLSVIVDEVKSAPKK